MRTRNDQDATVGSSSPAASGDANGGRAVQRSMFRGLSYAEGAAALTPVQRKRTAAAGADVVQMEVGEGGAVPDYEGWVRSSDGERFLFQIPPLPGLYEVIRGARLADTKSSRIFPFDPVTGVVYDDNGSEDIVAPENRRTHPLEYPGWIRVPGQDGKPDLYRIPPLKGHFLITGSTIAETASGRTYTFNPQDGKVYDDQGRHIAPKNGAMYEYAGWAMVGDDGTGRECYQIPPLFGRWVVEGAEIKGLERKESFAFSFANGVVFGRDGSIIAPQAAMRP